MAAMTQPFPRYRTLCLQLLSLSIASMQAAQALAALAQAEQASASALVEACLSSLAISTQQLARAGQDVKQVIDSVLGHATGCAALLAACVRYSPMLAAPMLHDVICAVKANLSSLAIRTQQLARDGQDEAGHWQCVGSRDRLRCPAGSLCKVQPILAASMHREVM